MELLTPSIGNIFWTSVVFLILVFLLGKFAWKPILSAINTREINISDALNQVKLAKAEMENLKADNKKIIQEAKKERENILKEARDIKERILAEAQEVAKLEGDKIIDNARKTILAERNAVVADIKSQIGELSVVIAESILKRKLDDIDSQNKLVADILNQSNLN